MLKIIILCIILSCKCYAQLREVFEWRQVSFVWPSEEMLSTALANGDYIPENNLPMGVMRWNNKMFITLPRWKLGVAATLTYIPLTSTEVSPALIPYPSMESNQIPKIGEFLRDDYVISVFRVQIDACDRLWMVDSGSYNFNTNSTQVVNQSIAVFDLNTDRLIRRYYLKETDIKSDGSSLIPDIIVDVSSDNCEQAFAYLPDLGGYGLIVYSFEENDSWRITHNFFYLDPLLGNLNIGGVNVKWNDGIFGMALGSKDQRGYRDLYFHPMISNNEFSVNTEHLRNRTLITSADNYDLFKVVGYRGRNSQSSVEDFDEKTNVLFMNQLLKDGIACWNIHTTLNEHSFTLFDQDHERLVFINDIMIDVDRNLWVLSDRMTNFLDSRLDSTDINYRILATTVDDAIRGTPCEQ